MTAGDGEPAEEIAWLRSYAAQLPAGSAERLIAEVDLAQQLIVRAAARLVADMDAAAADSSAHDAARKTARESAGEGAGRDAAEARLLLDGALSATTPGSAMHRWAALMSARATQMVGEADALDTAVRFLETALAAAPQWSLPVNRTDPAAATDDPEQWTAYNAVAARCELAGVLWERWTTRPPADGPSADGRPADLRAADTRVAGRFSADARPTDRDRTVTLLTEALAGPYATDLEDPELLHGTLGLALADRSRGPDHDSPGSRADLAAALRHLQESHRIGASTGVPDPTVTYNLALLRFFDHDEHCDPSTPPPADLGRLIAPLLALADDPAGDGAAALEVCVMLARDRYDHDGCAENESRLIDLHRRQMSDPGTSPRDVRAARTDLALLLIDRAEACGAGTGATDAGTGAGGGSVRGGRGERRLPVRADPQADLAEAAVLFEAVLAELRGAGAPDESAAERAEERLNCLAALVELLSAWLRTDLDEEEDDRIERLVRHGREFLEIAPRDDEARGLTCLKVGLALAQRVQRAAGPHLYRQPTHLLSNMVPDPALALANLAPGVREDSAQAIELLRTGIGFHHYQDDLYVAGAQALSVCLLLDHVLQLPRADPPDLREAVRWIRVVLGRAPFGSDRSVEEYEFLVIHSLMYAIWNGDPFTAPTGADPLGGLRIPDVSRHPSIEDDLQLLEQLLEAAVAREGAPQPSYVLLRFMIHVIRSPTLTDADCRTWWDRLSEVLRTGFDDLPLRVLLTLAAAAIGNELVLHGLATPAERAQVDRFLDEVEAVVGPGDDMHRIVAEMRLRSSRAARLFHGLLGAAAGGRAGTPGSGARPAAPAPRHPAPRRRPGAEPAEAPGTGQRGAGTGSTGTAHSAGPPQQNDTERGNAEPEHTERDDIEQEKTEQENAEILRIAAVLPGDGSPYPFTEPVGRVLEIAAAARAAERATADGDPLGRAVAEGVSALAWYDRWTHERETADLTRAIAATREAIGAASAAEPLTVALTALLAGMLLDRYTLLSDRIDLDAAQDTYAALLDRVASRSAHPGLVPLLRRHAEAAGQRRLGAVLPATPPLAAGDFHAGLTAAAATAALLSARSKRHRSAGARTAEIRRIGGLLREALDRLPDGHPRKPAVRSDLGLVDLDLARPARDGRALDDAVGAVVRAADECPPASAHRPALLLRAAVVLSAHQGSAEISGRLDRGIDLLSGALAEAEQGFHGGRARCLYGLGRLLLTRFGRDGRPQDLTRAVDVLREARTALNSAPGDGFSVILARAQSQAHRAYGPGNATQRRWSRETAKSVLAAHGRAVLLQTGTARALSVARAAGPDMLRLVRWCIEDGETAAALDALELGRGLVLNAATVAATLPALLREVGQSALATEWEAAGPAEAAALSAPDGMRRRVLEALEGGPAEARVLSAPTPAEVGRALRRVGADALVHLVPGEEGPGHALIVTATGTVETLPLRALNAAAERPLAAYADALREFQAAALRVPEPPKPTDPPPVRAARDRAERQAAQAQLNWGTALEAVCSWAGEVAMAGVLRWARERRPGRLPRLVLAPVGLLGVVPWQAARVAGPAGSDHACRLAVLSQCASARQLTEVAARRRLPWDGRHALVVDPDGSSVMHEEARLIRSAFYPRATVAGAVGWLAERDGPWTGPAPLPATPEAVLPLLPGRARPGVAVCHVNCHAEPGATTAESTLKLSRAHRLAIGELLAAARDPDAPGGLVVLANCVSDLALSDHDEALTLATALLSAGACAVVGSRWAVVDDRRTSILMYMFHHYLTGHGGADAPLAAGSPADALRAAQLWMLDPHRAIPAALRGIAVDTPERPFATPRIWAAFAHHGQ
jgi:CHAT domain